MARPLQQDPATRHSPAQRFSGQDVFAAWLSATVFSGIPSTAHALLVGADPLEATRAAGLMIVSPDVSLVVLVAAAALAHGAVSLFWTVVFAFVLPRRHILAWSVLGAAGVALLDLGLIAPRFFPAVAELAFWPQFADHLAWGALLGATLQVRSRQRGLPRSGTRPSGGTR